MSASVNQADMIAEPPAAAPKMDRVVLPPAVHVHLTTTTTTTTSNAAAAADDAAPAVDTAPARDASGTTPAASLSSAITTSAAVTDAVLHGDVTLLAKRWRRTAVHCAMIASRLFLIRIAFGVVKQLLKGHLWKDPRKFLTNCVLEVLSKNPVKWAAFGAGLASYRAWQETANALLDSVCLRLLRWIDVMTSAQAAERMRLSDRAAAAGTAGSGSGAGAGSSTHGGTETLPSSVAVSPRTSNLRRTPPAEDECVAPRQEGAAGAGEPSPQQRTLLSPKAGATLMTAASSTDPAEQRSLRAMLSHVPTASGTAEDIVVSPQLGTTPSTAGVIVGSNRSALRRGASHRRCVSFSSDVVVDVPSVEETPAPARRGLNGLMHPSASVNYFDHHDDDAANAAATDEDDQGGGVAAATDGSYGSTANDNNDSRPRTLAARSASWVLLDSLPLRSGTAHAEVEADDDDSPSAVAARNRRRREQYWGALAASPIFQQVQKLNRVLSSVVGAWFVSASARVFDGPTQVDLTMYLVARAAHCFMCGVVFPALPSRVADLNPKIWNPLAMAAIGSTLLSNFVYDPDTHAPAYQRFLLQATMLKWGQLHAMVGMDRYTFDPAVLDFAAQRGIGGIIPVVSLAPTAAIAAANAAVASAALLPGDITAQIAAAAAAKAVQPMIGVSGADHCALRHPGVSSCFVANLQYILKHVFQMSMPLYFPLKVVSTLAFGRKQLLRAPIKTIRKMITSSLASSLFLALYCGGPFALHCVYRATNVRSRPLVVGGAALMCGTWLMLEPMGRQLDLVLFCGMHSLRSNVMALYKKGVLRRPTMSDVECLHWLAWVVVCMTLDFRPGQMHANFLSSLRWLLGEKNPDKKLKDAKSSKDRAAAAGDANPAENPEVVALEQAEIQAVGM